MTGILNLLADGFMFLEAPRWKDGYLLVSDVFGRKVYQLTLDGARQVVCDVPNRPSGQGILPDGRHIVVSAADRKIYEIRNGSLVPYADLSKHASGYVNDFAMDARGRLYVGNFGYDIDAGEADRPTQLHRVDPDGSVTTIAEGLEFPNGSVMINGDRTLVVAETWVGRVTAFDVSDKGELSNRRIFADMGEIQPDGICTDAEGAIWVCSFNTGDVLRICDGGEITDRFKVDGRAVSCVLGGEDGRTLFVTAFLGPAEQIQHEARGAVLTSRVKVAKPA